MKMLFSCPDCEGRLTPNEGILFLKGELYWCNKCECSQSTALASVYNQMKHFWLQFNLNDIEKILDEE
jgi:hypothetical protein